MTGTEEKSMSMNGIFFVILLLLLLFVATPIIIVVCIVSAAKKRRAAQERIVDVQPGAERPADETADTTTGGSEDLAE